MWRTTGRTLPTNSQAISGLMVIIGLRAERVEGMDDAESLPTSLEWIWSRMTVRASSSTSMATLQMVSVLLSTVDVVLTLADAKGAYQYD